jgi:hypothetical protein
MRSATPGTGCKAVFPQDSDYPEYTLFDQQIDEQKGLDNKFPGLLAAPDGPTIVV